MKILFQGDSITDMGRSREHDLHMGAGYPAMVAGLLGVETVPPFGFLDVGMDGFASVAARHDAYVWCGATGLSD